MSKPSIRMGVYVSRDIKKRDHLPHPYADADDDDKDDDEGEEKDGRERWSMSLF